MYSERTGQDRKGTFARAVREALLLLIVTSVLLRFCSVGVPLLDSCMPKGPCWSQGQPKLIHFPLSYTVATVTPNLL